MGDRTNLTVRIGHHGDTLVGHGLQIRRTAFESTGNGEEHEVRGNPVRIEQTWRRLSQMTRADDAVLLRETLRKYPSQGVVFREPIDGAVHIIGQSHQPGRRKYAGLAHPTTEELARSTCTINELARAHHNAPDRCRQAFAQAERR